MTALGWARQVDAAPKGIWLYQAEDWVILHAHAGTARARLDLQVKCFEAGITFLPLRPHQQLSPAAAAAMLHRIDLDEPLRRLENCGQFTLSLTLRDAPPRHARDGRQWLTARSAQHGQRAKDHAILAQLAQACGAPSSPPRQTGRTVQCDILVARDRQARFRRTLQASAATLPAATDATLTVTGLWPPYGFCEVTRTDHGAAA